MLRKTFRTILLSAVLPIGGSLALVAGGPPAAAQFTVFDPTNYSQNVLTAARTLEQINNQLQSLQNEARSLDYLARNAVKGNFAELTELMGQLNKASALLKQAKGIGFSSAQLDAQFGLIFPDFDAQVEASDRARRARVRLNTAMVGLRHTMEVQARIAENIEADYPTLSKIAQRNDGAEGQLQAAQVTNQILGLATKQQMQIQQLMAAQYRAEAMEQARRAQAALDAQAATKKFLGTGTAYTPR